MPHKRRSLSRQGDRTGQGVNMEIVLEGIQELMQDLTELEKRQLPFALSKAINDTATQIRKDETQEMERALDRPTKYTLGSLYVQRSDKRNLTATVGFKDKSSAGKGNPASNYISPQILGGNRGVKRFESALIRAGVLPKGMYVTPGAGVTLDAHGNIPSALIVQILSYFRAFGEQGYSANITEQKKAAMKKGIKGQDGYAYFVSRGKGDWFGRYQHLPPGIYRRTHFHGGSSIKPIFMFVGTPTYSDIYDFFGVAQRTVARDFDYYFAQAWEYALRTAR